MQPGANQAFSCTVMPAFGVLLLLVSTAVFDFALLQACCGGRRGPARHADGARQGKAPGAVFPRVNGRRCLGHDANCPLKSRAPGLVQLV
jgi:hypothetical protein